MKKAQDDLLKAAVFFSQEFEKAEDKVEFFRLVRVQYEELGVPVVATLKRIAQAPMRVENSNSGTQRFVIEFAKHGLHPDHSYVQAYQSICKMMRLSRASQAAIDDYVGDYAVHRRGIDGLIAGSVTIGKRGPVPWFWHVSVQQIEGRNQKFNHEGVVIFCEDRVYLLGIGADYIRQLTVRFVSRPRETRMSGVVLTERWDADKGIAPMAAKVLLTHSSMKLSDAEIDLCLGSESELDGVLYGWKKEAR